jgi:hypothetical protein
MSTTNATQDRRIADEQGVDLSQTVYLGAGRYHADWGPLGHGCPNYDLTEGTLGEAIAEDLTPCQNCNPLDHCEEGQ